MADRYWVGGAGTWDATSTANWSDTSGGANGFSAPTSADNVIFNSASNATAYAVTVGTNATCLDVSIAGPAVGNVTITSAATSIINVHGSWLNAATGVAFASTAGCILNFLATTTGKTVTTNNIAIGALNVTFNSVSGGWTLGSAFNQAGAGISVAAGSFDTGSYAIISSLIISNGSIVRSIVLGSSTLTLSNAAPVSSSSVNLTLNAGTSTINCTNANVTFAGSGFTYYNVNFTDTTAAINGVVIGGLNTFNNLNVSTTTLQKVITLNADQTVNGTLTLGATNTAPFRMSVVSSVVGTPRALVVATLATLADVDFRDIVAAGTSSPWSGTRIGNCLGNSNINFDATKNVYWNLAAGGNWTSTAWALTSGGGAVAVNNFPLPQDYAIIENTGLNVGATITMNTNADIGMLDMSTRSTAFTLALNNTDPKFYDNVTLSSALTLTGNTAGSPTFNFLGQGTNNVLDTAGVILTLSQFIINCPTGTLTLVSNTTVELVATTSGTAILTAGEFILNDFNLTAVVLSSANTNTRAIAFGTGKIVITGTNGSVVNIDTATNFSYTGSGNIEGTYSGSVGTRTFVIGNTAGGSKAVALNLKVTAGTDTVNVYLHWNDLDFTGFSGTYGNPGNKIFYGNLTFSSGMTLQAAAGQSMTFNRTGTQTITSGTQTFTNLILYSEQLDNVNWVKTNTTVTADVIVAPDSTTTADLVLDTATAGVEHYITAQILTLTNQPYTQSVYVKASVAPSFLFMVVSIGASSVTSAITFTQTAGVYAPATTTNGLITSATATSVGNGWYRCSVIYTLNGTVTTHQMRLYPYLGGLYTGTGIGTYFWGAQGQIGATLTTYIPTTATTASTTGNRIIDYPVTFSNSGTTNCLDALTLGSTRALTFTGGTLNLAASTTSTVGSFVTTGTSPKFLGSTTVGTQATISDASGTNTVSYLTIKDSNATGGAVWNALSITNVDAGNNTGWLFSTTPSISNEITMRLRSFTQPRRF